jgi:hypothetical protein
MKPRTPEVTPQDHLFRSRLENLVSPRHPLVRLAERSDWEALNERLGAYYEDAAVGQRPNPTRLMAGLLYLKHTFSLSDEALLERWVEAVADKAYRGHETWPGASVILPGQRRSSAPLQHVPDHGEHVVRDHGWRSNARGR